MSAITNKGDSHVYTAISFAPVQGFIEKSRKLRDLFGASLILSYLSQQLADAANKHPDAEVISPALVHVQEGMPNRILVKGLFERNKVEQTLIDSWEKVLKICREWLETEAFPQASFDWDHEWLKWKQYSWEVFWGTGETSDAAMRDLERRKLKRDWVGVNWTGDSSSLTGTDAIAWYGLGKENKNPGRLLSVAEKDNLELFYRHLSWLLDEPDHRTGRELLSMEELKAYEKSNPDDIGRYIALNERLSIPELVKRLVTYHRIADGIGIAKLKKKRDDPEFKDIYRELGYWTGWFMGDGDRIGNRLKKISKSHGDSGLYQFSEAMRQWGRSFQTNKNQFPKGKGRVIYAGGDDFLGIIYSEKAVPPPPKIEPTEALDWLRTLPDQWKGLQEDLEKNFGFAQTYSVGFVWTGHQVPQRDILQHCREAEKRAKSLGRNRVTIRVVFNSGQYVQWTCPWSYLDVLTKYRDREGKQNWSHIYSDWAQLKSRYGIRLKDTAENADESLALAIFDLYFKDLKCFEQHRCEIFKEENDTPQAITQWMDGLINVGWQLCSNT